MKYTEEDFLADIEALLNKQKINDTHTVRLGLAEDYYKLGNYQEALINCNKAIEWSTSDFAYPNVLMVKILIKLGQTHDAVSLVNTLKESNADYLGESNTYYLVELNELIGNIDYQEGSI